MPVLLLLIAAPSIRGIVPRAAVTGMPAVATMATMATMATVATVSKHVHRDKYNADQHPKPIFYQPVHLDSFT